MYKITNKPSLYKFLLKKIDQSDNKSMYKDAIRIVKKEKLFRNTDKLNEYLKKNLNFKDNSSTFLFNLSSNIFEFSRLHI